MKLLPEGKQWAMLKKIQAFFLCVALGILLAGCNGQGSQDLKNAQEDNLDSNDGKEDVSDSNSEDGQKNNSDSSPENSGKDDEDASEPMLGEDATDEELLEVINDKITVVTDDNFMEMVAAFTEKTEDYSGQIYQLEGLCTMKDGMPYVARTIVDGEEKIICGMPLKYVTEEHQEGSWIRVTGIVNKGEMDGKTMAVLEVVVLQVMEEQGQAELPAH